MRAEKGGIKGGRESASFCEFSPKGRKEEWGCSPDRSEDVLFCFSSALPLPAGSNITLGTKALASTGHSDLVLMCAVYRCNGSVMERRTDVQQVKGNRREMLRKVLQVAE